MFGLYIYLLYIHTQGHGKLSWEKGDLNYRIRTEKHHSLRSFKVGFGCILEGRSRAGHCYRSGEDQMGEKSESTVEVKSEMDRTGNIQKVFEKLS